ncbi:MAG: 2Fe-2S iron-sulfur cluster-binding protein [Patescibacteria group bacterium]|nr:2Fe-2S iron-sulfur cluster-binding protein [Patescibacteria group bacterium]
MAIIKINGKEFEAKEEENLLQFLLKEKFPIPHLCYHPDYEPAEACRLCLIEVDGKIKTSCSVKIKDGLNVITNSEKIRKIQMTNLKLIGLSKQRKAKREKFNFDRIIEFDMSRCVDCQLCLRSCPVEAIEMKDYGANQTISPTDNRCLDCGKCLVHCPASAINTDKKEYERIVQNIKTKKLKIAQVAPSIRATLGELFDFPHSKMTGEKVASSIKALRFDYVFDTSFAADITTLEEAKELIERLKTGEKLPLLTSCCPGWINYLNFYKQDLKPLLTSVLPPEIIAGNLIKHYFAKKVGLKPSDIYLVSIMPCTAKKSEVRREELLVDKIAPVDDVLTTIELATLLKQEKIDFKNLKEEKFDNPLGEATGAGIIFGVTGGVMTAALRTAYYLLSGKNPDDLYFQKEITSLEGVKIFNLEILGKKLRIAIIDGLKNFYQIKDKLSDFDYIEVMACPGGCIAGGGQPRPVDDEIRKKRKEVLLRIDKEKNIKTSHDNPYLKKIYHEFLINEKAIHKFCHLKH